MENGFPRLNLPPIEAQVRDDEDGIRRIYDPMRRKWVALTPEELVRQHFTSYLIRECGYPAGLMANEVGIKLNETQKRCDTVVYGRDGLRPLAIVEYKAPSINITQKVFDQIARYCSVLRVPCLIVSNGVNHYCCLFDPERGGYRFVRDIPTYDALVSLL